MTQVFKNEIDYLYRNMGKKVKKEAENAAMAMMTPEQQALMQQVMIMMQG